MKIHYAKSTTSKAIDRTIAECQQPLNEIYVRIAATATVQEIKETVSEDDVDVQNFRINCRNFLVESIHQLQQHFGLDSEIYDIIQCISPQKAAARIPPSLVEVVKKLPYLNEVLDAKKLDTKCRQHIFDPNFSPHLEWGKYWSLVKDAKIPSGQAKYPNLTKFVEVLASFPFTNAAVETVFILLKRVKTDNRQHLKSSSLVSVLQCKLGMKNGKSTAANLKPGKRVLDLVSKMKSNATDGETKNLKVKFLDELFD